MALPTKQKTHTWSANNRSAYVSLAQVIKDVLYGIKAHMKTNGFTVKGSCDGTTGSMDGTDRWANAASVGVRGAGTGNAQAWIVLEHAGMGGAEILFCWQGSTDDKAKVAISPGGNWVAAGTPNQQPTATDELIIHANTASFINGTTSLDRIWSCDVTTDGTQLNVLVARNNVWVEALRIAMTDTTGMFGGSAAWSPAVAGWSRQGATDITDLFTTANIQVRTNGGAGYANATAFYGVEGYANTQGPVRVNFAPEMQGGASFLLWPCSLWSETAGARGKLGNAIDIWAGYTAANDGDTYPNDATRQFIQLGDIVLPWDGSAVVMA